jgi:lysozyme
VAAKNRKAKKFLLLFIIITLIAAGCFVCYLGYLWWEARQLEAVRYREFGTKIPAEYEIHGIDVSRYQQDISWEAVREMSVGDVKIGFAFIKATEGIGNTDPFFKKNWRKIKKAGIVRGAYHYFIASKDGRSQAKNFIRKVELESGDLPPVLDVEQSFGSSPEKIRREISAWLQTAETYYGVKPIIYTYIDFYEHNLKGYFDDYPLWVAHYLQPHQPRITRDWTFWQHSESGHVNGIISRVDFNVFNGDSNSFRALLVP